MNVGKLVRIKEPGNYYGKIGIIVGEVPWSARRFLVFVDGKNYQQIIEFS